jgi:hypothetical protein
MSKIVTKSSTDQLADWITEFLARSPAKLIRIDGVCGSGKTTVSRKLAAKGVGLHIEADKFAVQQLNEIPYSQCLKQDELDAAIAGAIRTGQIVILDAVCLEEVAPVERWGRGLNIYVKMLSFNGAYPIWHAGFNLEDEPPMIEPHRSVHAYHLKYTPHMNADLIIEFSGDDLDQLPKMPLSRERCFDPPNSVVEST